MMSAPELKSAPRCNICYLHYALISAESIGSLRMRLTVAAATAFPTVGEQCRCCRLSNAAGCLGSITIYTSITGGFIDSHHAIVVEVTLFDTSILEGDLAS